MKTTHLHSETRTHMNKQVCLPHYPPVGVLEQGFCENATTIEGQTEGLQFAENSSLRKR